MKPQTFLQIACLFAFVGCAGQTYRVDAGPMFIRARGEVALASSANNGKLDPPNANQSIDGNMGLGDTEPSPYLRFETNADEHRFRVSGFLLDEDGDGVLASPYGNIAAGTQVQTSMEFFAIRTNYAYQFLRNENWRLGIGGQVGWYSLDVAARAPGGREEVQTSVIVPMPFVEAEWLWRDLTVGANFGIMAGDLGDARGRYWDFEAYGNWQIDPDFGVKFGYRYLLLDGYGRATGRDFDADVDVQGLFVTAGIRF
ncbi:MAG: hypothetical protein AB8H80_01670 [Planctomycetota bacterium]